MNICTVISNIALTHNTYLLQTTKNIEFTAGQFVAIGLGKPEQDRLYSIASGQDEPTLTFLYEVVPGGVLTNQLCRLRKGDQITVSQAMGSFLPTHKKAFWIATGTGIAPFIAMLKSDYGGNKTLLQGARSPDGFFFHNQFTAQMGDRYHRFCTTQSGDGIIFGRITHYLEQEKNLEPDILYYLCGNNQMVIDVREILLRKGVPYENIRAEIYF